MKKIWLSVLLATAAVAGQAAEGCGSVLLVTGSSDEPFHHWRETAASIREVLGEAGCFDVRTVEDARGLTAASLAGYDALLVDYNGPRWSRETEAAMEGFVNQGKGLIAFHLAAYGTFFGMEEQQHKWRAGKDAGWEAFRKMIGAWWEPEKIGHARRTVFTVNWTDREHPIAAGLGESFVANDELYHKLTLAGGTKVLADSKSPVELGGTGNREPMIWVNRYGKGRVFFTTLGHDREAWYMKGFRTAFARGVEWAATGTVRSREAEGPKPVRLLVVTGGHSYPESFYRMVDSLPQVKWTHTTSLEDALARPIEDRYDALMFHDLTDTTSERTRARLKAFVDAGKGVVSIHHAIVDFTDWPYWYEDVIGGKYFVKAAEGHEASRYHEGVDYLVTPVAGKNHPVLRGVSALWVNDELYRGMWISPKVEVLMETHHPENDVPVVYVGPHPKARVLYIQLGHSDSTMRDPMYQKLVSNAVNWVARRTQ